MNSLYRQLLSHDFTLKKVGDMFVLCKNNVAFVEKGKDKLEAFILIGDKEAKPISSDIDNFERVKSIYYGLTGELLTETIFELKVNGESHVFDKFGIKDEEITLGSEQHTVNISKKDLYRILERVENEVAVKSSTPIIKRILNRINLL